MSLFASAARSAALAGALCCAAATAPHAHPHVYIDAGLEVIVDETGRLTHVRVSWRYDQFYSLLIAEERKVDGDGDGNTEADEEIWLAGFDMFWAPDYSGDLVVRLDGQPLVLSRPMEPTAQMRDGQITTSHLREVTGQPVIGADMVSIKVFDESYYTAFTLSLPVSLTGPDACTLERIEPNIDGELAAMQAMLLSIDADADLEEMDIPLAGEKFATDVRITCQGLG
ncbi:ABC-type uncharacterized transport system substrate-binding protein [Litoreibacter ponti]|uniref:ABC-type uncharacterized transport system substrate-binding protein n=1 Tax=Litoreibacter ponti TaxID=1510457 RepID=A0A2T6BFD0_9RHOB|nr:DUF1007 family protein [Litoreibacter ponti]PTX54773.1 ABC-type uncharacterized transport system substrate-binding protein [Litoreibacter ponti]